MKQLLTILCSLPVLVASANGDSALRVQLKHIYAQQVSNFTTDNLGNMYLLTNNNQVKKLDDKGDSIAVFNDVRRYGQIHAIDASNPLKVLVYYKDYSTILVLDRLLNVRNTIDLRKQKMLQVSSVTVSYDNNIWLYDEMESKIRKIDDNGRQLMESVDLRQALGVALSPEALFDRDGQLYLYDENIGLLVFDYYGAQKQKHALAGTTDLQVLDKHTITGRDSSRILLYKPATLMQYSFTAMPQLSSYKKIHFSGKHIYALTHEGELRLYVVE